MGNEANSDEMLRVIPKREKGEMLVRRGERERDREKLRGERREEATEKKEGRMGRKREAQNSIEGNCDRNEPCQKIILHSFSSTRLKKNGQFYALAPTISCGDLGRRIFTKFPPLMHGISTCLPRSSASNGAN